MATCAGAVGLPVPAWLGKGTGCVSVSMSTVKENRVLVINDGVVPIGCAKSGLSTAACVARSQRCESGCRPANSNSAH